MKNMLAPRMRTSTSLTSAGKMRGAFSSITTILVLLVYSITATPAHGLSDKQQGILNKNALYYNVDACSSLADSTDDGNPSANDGPVFMVGDSITLGAKESYKLGDRFKKKGMNAYIVASGGASIKGPGTTGEKKSGIQMVEASKSEVSDAGRIVIALGTNDYPQGFKENIKDLVNKVRSYNQDATIYWVNIKTSAPGNPAYTKEGAKKKNDIIENSSKDLKFEIIDIYSSNVPLAKGDWIHPEYSNAGFGRWGDVVVEGVSNDGVSTPSVPAKEPSNLKYIKAGKIPESGLRVGATYYGGNYSNGGWKPSNDVQSPGQNNDDNGRDSYSGKPIAGRTAIAELSMGTALGDLPYQKDGKPNTKLEITYKGKSIIAEKVDIGRGNGNSFYKVDLWWETARLLGVKGENPTIKVRAVDPSTPVTPLSGSAEPVAEPDTSSSTDCACPDGTEQKTTGVLTGKGNEEKIWNFFRGKGLNAIQTAGIMGNMSQESGYIPTRAQVGGTTKDPSIFGTAVGVGKAWGLIQWDAGGRAIEYAKQANIKTPIYELETQLNLVWWHMTNTSPTGAKNMLSNYKASNEKEAVRIYERLMEGAGTPAYANREAAATAALKKFGDSSPSNTTAQDTSSASDSGSSNCETTASTSGDQSVTSDGYALPVQKEGVNLPCRARTCHHDNTPAADLGVAPKWEGKPVYAITDGKISNFHYRSGQGKNGPAPPECKSLQLIGKDGWAYWYGHIKGVTVKNGQSVKAGQKIAVIGQSRCADDTDPHLHIDRGSPKGQLGGSKCCRDPGFIPLLNKIYEDSK